MKKLFTVTLAIFVGSLLYVNGQITNSFFEHVDYRGAFGTTDWTDGWANWDPQNTVYPATTVNVSGDITSNTTWTSSNVYFLSGFVYVKTGATLTIQPGTIIRGDKSTKGTLIIERGGKINAVGTSISPIVFTSNVDAGSRDYGDWGGVVICGKASINVTGGEAIIEGGPTSYYGGATSPDDADSSGILKYVRIEFSGVALQPNQEINGLTMGGVGSKTIIENIQVSYCGDDSYEWFGGEVNAKYLIAFRGWDDDFDTDFGYRGNLQFLVSLRDPNIADQSGSNGFESDNDASGSTNLPQTNPTFSNVSIFGPKVISSTSVNSNYKRAMHIRRNSALNVYNSIFAGFPTGLYIDGATTQTNANNSVLNVNNCVLSGMSTFFDVPSGGTVWTSAAAARAWYLNSARENDTLANNVSLNITDPFNLTSPDFLPQVGSEMLINSFWYPVASVEQNQSLNFIVTLYPNPASTTATLVVNVTNDDHFIINIYDISGKMVKKIVNEKVLSGLNTYQISLDDIQEGLYFVKIISTHGIKTSKLVKQ